MRLQKTFTYVGVLAIVLLLVGLVGWYFFLSRETSSIEDQATARGFGISVPAFLDSRGSTAANIETGFSVDTGVINTGSKPPRLWRVSTSPVAGADFLEGTGTTTILRFVERSTGQVFDADVSVGGVARRTNKLTPKVYDARVGREGTIIKQYLDKGSVVTTSGTLATSTDENGFSDLSETNLGVTARDIQTARFTSDILFLAETAQQTHLIRSRSDGNTPAQLFSLLVGGFDILWLRDRIVLKERTGSGISSSAYEVGERLTPLVRNVPGLTILPRASSTALIYGSDNGSSLALFVQPAIAVSTISLNIATVADKCVWADGPYAYCGVPQSAPSPGFLDNWYKGAVHTTDTWYRVDTSAGTAQEFYKPNSTIAIDVERPIIDDTGEYLAFINARDKSLWVLRLKE
jgi:hypothetical protein